MSNRRGMKRTRVQWFLRSLTLPARQKRLFMMIAFWIAFVFLIGLNVGSFLNVAIARLPMEKSLIWPGSRCMACAQPIRWFDNLPILGYLFLRGKCRTCGAPFSVRYLLVELATALGLV